MYQQTVYTTNISSGDASMPLAPDQLTISVLGQTIL